MPSSLFFYRDRKLGFILNQNLEVQQDFAQYFPLNEIESPPLHHKATTIIVIHTLSQYL